MSVVRIYSTSPRCKIRQTYTKAYNENIKLMNSLHAGECIEK